MLDKHHTTPKRITTMLKILIINTELLVADSEADLQERLVDWKEIFGKHGLRVSLEKDIDIRLGGKKLNQRESFVYLGGAVCGTETKIRRRL